jgi:hypothetical protein
MLNMLRDHGKKLISGLALSGILAFGSVAAAQEQPAPSCGAACPCGCQSGPCGCQSGSCSCGGQAGSCSCQAGSCSCGGPAGASCSQKPVGQPNQGAQGQAK